MSSFESGSQCNCNYWSKPLNPKANRWDEELGARKFDPLDPE